MKYLHQTYQNIQAPELFGDFWFNSDPLLIQSLRGQAVVLFFFDFSFPSSLQFLPVIKDIDSRYHELGLVCIGVHSPEFSFGKEQKEIESALQRCGIAFPVIADNEKRIANAYHVPANPQIVLIGSNGIVYDQIGSMTGIIRVERSIQYLLRQSGFYGELPMLEIYGDRQGIIYELFTGYLHGSLGNSEGFSPELTASYEDPKIYIQKKFYLHGDWLAERNACTYAGKPNDGYIISRMDSHSMKILTSSPNKSSVKIKIDGAPVKLVNMGHDVKKDKQGNTYFSVLGPNLISAVKNENADDHLVKIIPLSTETSFYLIAYEYNSDFGKSSFDEMIRNN